MNVKCVLPYETRKLIREWLVAKVQCLEKEKDLSRHILEGYRDVNATNYTYEFLVKSVSDKLYEIQDKMIGFNISDEYQILDGLWITFVTDDNGDLSDIEAFSK